VIRDVSQSSCVSKQWVRLYVTVVRIFSDPDRMRHFGTLRVARSRVPAQEEVDEGESREGLESELSESCQHTTVQTAPLASGLMIEVVNAAGFRVSDRSLTVCQKSPLKFWRCQTASVRVLDNSSHTLTTPAKSPSLLWRSPRLMHTQKAPGGTCCLVLRISRACRSAGRVVAQWLW
jgi:hypothetical protein